MSLVLFCHPLFAEDFPGATPSMTDPFTGDVYQNVKVSETFEYRKWGKYYLWRYVTLYNQITKEEPVKNVPIFEENCHDQGDRVASWEFTRGYERTINTGASLSMLGFLDIDFGGEITRSFEVSITRWIQAELGVHALHIPLIKSESLVGVTFKQYYYPNSNNIVEKALSKSQFEVNYLKPIFKVERQIIGECIEN